MKNNALIVGGFRARLANKLRNAALGAGIAVLSAGVAVAQSPTIDTAEVEAVLDTGAAKVAALGTAGMVVTAVFVLWSISRRGVKKLGGS